MGQLWIQSADLTPTLSTRNVIHPLTFWVLAYWRILFANYLCTRKQRIWTIPHDKEVLGLVPLIQNMLIHNRIKMRCFKNSHSTTCVKTLHKVSFIQLKQHSPKTARHKKIHTSCALRSSVSETVQLHNSSSRWVTSLGGDQLVVPGGRPLHDNNRRGIGPPLQLWSSAQCVCWMLQVTGYITQNTCLNACPRTRSKENAQDFPDGMQQHCTPFVISKSSPRTHLCKTFFDAALT